LHANHHALSRVLSEGNEQGGFFNESLAGAKYLVDSDLSSLLVVNSFNQWHEDTHIEPARSPQASTPENLTEGRTFYGYGDLYLEILRNATEALNLTKGADHHNGIIYPLR
jgi:hypothetical protein